MTVTSTEYKRQKINMGPKPFRGVQIKSGYQLNFSVFSRISSSSRTPPPRQAINNHRSLQRAVLAAENDLLEHNGVSDSKLQFIHGTCDVTGCILAEGVLDSLLFRLDIF